MKSKLFLIIAFFPIICFSQSNKHNLFGIDLDLGWNSLTGQQALAYYNQDQDKSSQYVITDCDYIHDKINSKFLNLGLTEMLLVFPKGSKGRLDELQPELFIARKYYANLNDYNNNSYIDIVKIKSLLTEVYGNPELNMKKDKFSIYKWKGVYYQIIITCREDELTSTLIYTKE